MNTKYQAAAGPGQAKGRAAAGPGPARARPLAWPGPGRLGPGRLFFWIYFIFADFNLSGGCFPICLRIFYKIIQILYNF